MAVDSEAVLKRRGLQVGLLAEDLHRLSAAGWDTYGTLAMASDGQPGQVADEKFETSVIGKILPGEARVRIPCLKRLYLEAYSACLVDMKRTVEQPNEEAAPKIPEVEKRSRMTNFTRDFPGAKVTGIYEPASSLVDEYIHMVRTGCVKFLDWPKLLSRDDEVRAKKQTSLKSASVKWEANSTGLVALADIGNDNVETNLTSDYLVRCALHRRSVAVHIAGLCEFLAHEQLVDTYFERKHDHVPPGYRAVTLEQVKLADEMVWKHLSDLTRGGSTSTGASIFPASAIMLEIMKRADVELHLRPLPLSSSASTSRQQPAAQAPPAQPTPPMQKRKAVEERPEARKKPKLPRVPAELSGHHAVTKDGTPICFAYNMKSGCPSGKPPGARCSRGVHVCCHRSGCEKKHPLHQHE